MSMQGRRSSLLNIDNWLDKCSNDEPDSMIYDSDYSNDIASMRTKQKESELLSLYKVVTEMCTTIGLPPEIVEERLGDIDDCISTFLSTIQKDVQEEYDKLCEYKQDLLNQIQKMMSDLYLPAYVPEENITLIQHCKRLKTKFNELDLVKKKRMTRLQELRDKQAKHCLVLGIKAPQIKMQTDIPTEEELVKLANAVLDLEKEVRRRKDKYTLLLEMITKCMDQLEYEGDEDLITGEPDYTESHLLKMSNLHSKLEAQYASNQEKFEKLKTKLVSLYDRLDVCKEEREQFFESHSTCKPTLLHEMEEEIERYEELKRQNIGKFIDKIKEELVVEYDRCFVHKNQQDNFFSLSTVSGECNEELLELYEEELERIKAYYESNKEILEKFHKWLSMWDRLKKLEEKATDPNRFTNRGGQLLLEEKERKNLQKGLPKVEKELSLLNDQYSASNEGNKFKILDTNLDDYISACWDKLNTDKELQKRERQRAKMTNDTSKGRNPPIKRSAGAGITPTPSKLKCQRSVLGTPSTTSKSNHQALSLSEQEFEDMIITRPASARRTRLPRSNLLVSAQNQ